jgi:hypothetical protein
MACNDMMSGGTAFRCQASMHVKAATPGGKGFAALFLSHLMECMADGDFALAGMVTCCTLHHIIINHHVPVHQPEQTKLRNCNHLLSLPLIILLPFVGHAPCH